MLHFVTWLQESNLQLVHGDVLQLNLQELIDRVTHAAEAAQQQQDAGAPSSTSSSADPQQPSQRKRRKVKVVANLPYNITKDFLVALFPKGDLIAELSIMIQVSWLLLAPANCSSCNWRLVRLAATGKGLAHLQLPVAMFCAGSVCAQAVHSSLRSMQKSRSSPQRSARSRGLR
jgi:hypothetical protein